MNHYSIKHGICIIDVSTLIYHSSFNWAIFTRTLDECYDEMGNNLIVKFIGFKKLFTITKLCNRISNKNEQQRRKENLVEKILTYAYNILVINSNNDAIDMENDRIMIDNIEHLTSLIKEAIDKYGLIHDALFIETDDEMVNKVMHKVIDERLIIQ